jgi:hypothetical protein
MNLKKESVVGLILRVGGISYLKFHDWIIISYRRKYLFFLDETYAVQLGVKSLRFLVIITVH